MQMLGVRYFMAQSPEAKGRADDSDRLRLVATVPDYDDKLPKGWKIYEIKGWNLAQPLKYEPVVVSVKGGPSSRCFGTATPASGAHDPELAPWECAAAPWWMNGNLDRPFAGNGPEHWARAASVAAADKVTPRPLPAVTVSGLEEKVDSIAFHVSRVGVPVVVKTSYFPNWKAHGAQGPWRLAPNLMVVVPTSHDVKLTYGLTTGDRAGRVLTVLGLLGIVALARVRPAAPPAELPPNGSPLSGVGAVEAVKPEEPANPEEPGAAPDGEGTEPEPGEPDEDAGRPDEVPALP
jgi:hypothetical protein